MKVTELKDLKTTINWLLENGEFKDKETSYNIAMNSVDILENQLTLTDVSKLSLADVEIEYNHPTGKKKGKLKYDDDNETLILDYKVGFITLPKIEDCNVC